MISKYVKDFIIKYPINKRKDGKAIQIDLILGGGAFNGSYMIGCMYLIKEMQNMGYIVVNRISGTSIGSIIGFLFLIDKLDEYEKLNEITSLDYKINCNLSNLIELKKMLNPILPDNVLDIINNKLYISYTDVVSCKKRIKYRYKNINNVIESLIRSCYIPFLINYSLTYKKKYIDGILPFIFEPVLNRRILHINIMTYDKLFSTIRIKNETNICNRVFCGLFDIHNFFMNEKNTLMCSYIDKWGNYEFIIYLISLMCEKVIMYCIHFYNKIRKTSNNYFIKNDETIVKYVIDKIIYLYFV